VRGEGKRSGVRRRGTGDGRSVAGRRCATDFGIPNRPVVRVDEAAALLACSHDQVIRLGECGRLDAVHIGAGFRSARAHVRITTESIRRLVGASQ
jgi:hypothetical protein